MTRPLGGRVTGGAPVRPERGELVFPCLLAWLPPAAGRWLPMRVKTVSTGVGPGPGRCAQAGGGGGDRGPNRHPYRRDDDIGVMVDS